MNKLLKNSLLIVLAFVLTLSFVGCANGNFLSENQINKLGEKLGLEKTEDGFVNPTAFVTVNFVKDSHEYTVVFRYELLFDKAPVTVNNFIALAKDGFYDNTVVDYTNEYYTVFGRYIINGDGEYEKKTVKYTIKGEFEANGWYVNGKDGTDNATHQIGCLGMYHDAQTATKNYFDSASTAFYMTWSNAYGSDKVISNSNYAVFAYLTGTKVAIDDQLGNDFVNGLDSALAAVMRKINTTSGVKTADGEQPYYAPTDSVKLVSVVIESMSGSADTSYRIK